MYSIHNFPKGITASTVSENVNDEDFFPTSGEREIPSSVGECATQMILWRSVYSYFPSSSNIITISQ